MKMTEKFLTFATDDQKNELKNMLRERVVLVTFQKKDGTERKMQCTLAESEIPDEKSPKGAGKTQSSDALAVFDVENQGWRSFRFDSIKEINGNV
jgi:hypothetical protein